MKFILNNEVHEPLCKDPNITLLQYLRNVAGLKGSKEGCASGDCGACTVVLIEPASEGIAQHTKSLNACITLLATLADKHIFTVDGLTQSGALHPAQQAMVDHHGSQCGFCTPGFVMSLVALYEKKLGNNTSSTSPGVTVNRAEVCDAISGNLCRCTGYRPIVDAGLAMPTLPVRQLDQQQALAYDASLLKGEAVLSNSTQEFFLPETELELQNLLKTNPQAKLIAGGTDLSLEITQKFHQFSTLIGLTRIKSLATITYDDEYLQFGACATYSTLEEVIAQYSPPFSQVLHRLGSRQIRNQGTVGGNIANGSPIADIPPILLAWNADIEVVDADNKRTWHSIDKVFLDYRKTILKPGEYIANIRILRTNIDHPHRFFKLSKRFEDDISAVMAAFSLDMEGGLISHCRLAFGGMAATPVRAKTTETLLAGNTISPSLIDLACTALAEELQPISDVRASAHYRLSMAQNLLRRALLEIQDNSVIDVFHYPSNAGGTVYA